MNKNTLVCIFMLIGSAASANPYFRLVDPSHPQPVLGALLAPDAMGQTEAATLLPLVTHSPKDGKILPIGENWSPLSVGASMNAGKVTFDVAPIFDLMPWMVQAVEAAAPTTIRFVQDPTVELSAGPVWEYKQSTNKGYFRVFTGVALHF